MSASHGSINQSRGAAQLLKRAGSLLAVVGVVSTWVAKAELCAGLQLASGPGALNFDKPFFISYFIITGYSLFLPLWFMAVRYKRWRLAKGDLPRVISSITPMPLPPDSPELPASQPVATSVSPILQPKSTATTAAATTSSSSGVAVRVDSPLLPDLVIGSAASDDTDSVAVAPGPLMASGDSTAGGTAADLAVGGPAPSLAPVPPVAAATTMLTRTVVRWGRWRCLRRCGLDGPPSHNRTVVVAGMVLAVINEICGLTYVMSLSGTPVSVNTTVYNAQCVVVFMLSVWLLGEVVTLMKAASVLICIIGVGVVSLAAAGHKDSDIPLTLGGMLALIISMLLYAGYEVLFKLMTAPAPVASAIRYLRRVDDEIAADREAAGLRHQTSAVGTMHRRLDSHDEHAGVRTRGGGDGKDSEHAVVLSDGGALSDDDTPESAHSRGPVTPSGSSAAGAAADEMTVPAAWAPLAHAPLEQPSPVHSTMLFLGTLGFTTAVVSWPGIFIGHYSGLEVWQTPSYDVWMMLLISLGMDAVLNICMLVGILWSSPLFMAVGTLLTIPTSVVADYFVHGYQMHALSYVGIAAIIIGFCGLTFFSKVEH